MTQFRTALTLGLATVAVLGMLLAVPGLGQAAPTHTPLPVAQAPRSIDGLTPRSVAAGGIVVESGYDYGGVFNELQNFYNGPGQDDQFADYMTVYFEINPIPNAADAGDKVAVSIDDENATRDGLSNPVWSVSVTLSPAGQANDINGVAYSIPRTLALGGQWLLNATVTATPSITDQVPFYVHTWDIVATFDNEYHLPGDSAKVFYQVLSDDSGGLVNSSVDVAATGCYEVTVLVPCGASVQGISTSSAGTLGNVTLNIPTNARIGSFLYIFIWANSSTASLRYSEETAAETIIVQVLAPSLCAGTESDGESSSCTGLTFTQGTQLVLRVTAETGTSVGNDEGTMPYVTVSVNWSEAGVKLTTPSGFPSSLETDGSGVALGLFSTADISPGVVTIGVFITDPNDNQLYGQNNLTITIVSAASSVVLQVTLGQGQYFGGDSLTGTFTILSASSTGGSSTAPAGWAATYYTIHGLPGATSCTAGFANPEFLFQGTLSGTSGNIPSFTVPTDLTGLLAVDVYAANSTQTATIVTATQVCAVVSPPTLLVNPSEVQYVPGDTISVSLTPEGTIFTKDSPVTYYATVSDESPLCGGTQEGSIYSSAVSTSFSFTIPQAGTLTEYTLSVLAQASSGVIASQDLCLSEISGFQLSVSVGTPSQYSDDSYQPGQTITLNYQLEALGTATLPQSVVLYVDDLATNAPEQRSDQSSPSGSFSYTIPKSSGTGLVLLEVEADVVTSTGTQGVYTYTGVDVESSPSVLNYELGAGSGFTVGLLIVILLIVVLIVIGLLYLRHRRNMGPGGPQHFHEFHGHQPEPMGDQGVQPTEAGPHDQAPYDPGGVHPGDPSLGAPVEHTYVPPPGIAPEGDSGSPPGLPPPPPPPPP